MAENRPQGKTAPRIKQEKQRSITKGFTAALCFSILIVFIFGIFASVFYTSFKARNSLEEKADEYINSLCRNLEIPMWSLNEPVIERIGTSFASNDLVTEVKITDTWDNVLFLKKKEEKGVVKRNADIVHEGSTAGHAEISLNMRHFELIKKDFLLTSAIILIFSLVFLLILLTLFLRRFFHTPLHELGAIVKRYASGNYDPPETRIPYAEFAPITDLLERMGRTIDSQMQRLNRELSERKEAEQALLESEKKYRELVENINDVIYTTDEQGRISYISPVVERITGFSSLLMTGESIFDFLHPEDLSCIQNMLRNTSSAKSETFECRMVTKEKGYVWVRLNSLPVYENSRIRGMRGMFSDISKEKILEERLRHAQKAEALGTLTGGIAHDFNNILGIILGYTEIARSEALPSDPVQKSLEQINSAGLRARDIVKQLLTFTRKDDAQEQHVTDIRPVAKEALEMLKSTIPSSIEFKSDIAPDLPMVELSGTQIHQILVNLCTNAAHAMEERGVINICMEEVSLGKEEAAFDPELVPGDYVKTTVTDTGHGISEKNLSRIFDPYFTTKDVGKGSGLGLSTILGIVKGRNGGIRVSSRLGEGTVFEIFLPAVKATPKTREPESELELLQGSGQILLVDDEEMLVDTGHQLLEALGYQVTSTTDPEEALEWFKKSPCKYDLLITDMTMPRMTGDMFAREAHSIRQDVPVILCTGHNSKISKASAAESGFAEYLQKPVDMNSLARAVRKALDRTAGTGKTA
ncbi:MAG: response regulator [Desulfobacteraceae bacterium]